MKLPTVDKFFFFLSLESGALVLASMSIITSVSIVSLASWFLVRYINFYSTLNQTDQDFFRTFLITFIFVYTVYVLYFALVFVAAVMLIVGTKNRDHNQLMLYMIMMSVGVIVSFIQILQLGVFFLVPSILAAVCSIYFFVCIYSLYKTFKMEKIRVQSNGTTSTHFENVALRSLY